MASSNVTEIRNHILASADHVEAALRDAKGLDGLPERDRIETVSVIATGDDEAAGDVLQSVAAPFVPLPITVLHDYELPAYVGDSSLVFAISSDGDTEEVIDVTTTAVTQGARVVVIGNGQLAKEAAGWGVPLLVPPTPENSNAAAVSYSACVPLVILEELGFYPGGSEWINAAAVQLRERSEDFADDNNIAKKLADSIGLSIPMFYGGGLLGASAARRWKVSFNIISNAPAFWNSYPDAAHSDLAGWSNLEGNELSETAKRRLFVVNLRHDSEHPQISEQFALVAERVQNAVVGVDEIWASGEGELAQLLDLMMVGDMVSTYMSESLSK